MSPVIEGSDSHRANAVKQAFESTDWGEQQVEMGSASHKAGMLEQFFRKVGDIFSRRAAAPEQHDDAEADPDEYHTTITSTEAMIRAMTKSGKKTK